MFYRMSGPSDRTSWESCSVRSSSNDVTASPDIRLPKRFPVAVNPRVYPDCHRTAADISYRCLSARRQRRPRPDAAFAWDDKGDMITIEGNREDYENQPTLERAAETERQRRCVGAKAYMLDSRASTNRTDTVGRPYFTSGPPGRLISGGRRLLHG